MQYRPENPWTALRHIALAAAVAGAAGCLPPPPAGATEAREGAACVTDLRPELRKLKVPGLAAGIVKNGRLVCTSVAGKADIAAGRPVTPDTLFLLASVSKTVTATALMQLAERGRIGMPRDDLSERLDADINDYLPFKVKNIYCKKPGRSRITFRQLLTHTSSIRDYPGMDVPPTPIPGDDPAQIDPAKLGEELESYLTPKGANWKGGQDFDHNKCPGEVNEYSNLGATLLGYLVQVIDGRPFQSVTKDGIFRPLWMMETSWNLAGLPDRTHIATPYYRFGDGFTALPQYGEWDYPDGMLRTSVRQLSRFLAMFIRGGTHQGRRVLRAATVAEMRRRQTDLDDEQALMYYYDTFGPNSRNVLGHNGEDSGAAANMFLDPPTGAGVILLANGGWYDEDGEETPAAKSLMDRLLKEAKTRR